MNKPKIYTTIRGQVYEMPHDASKCMDAVLSRLRRLETMIRKSVADGNTTDAIEEHGKLCSCIEVMVIYFSKKVGETEVSFDPLVLGFVKTNPQTESEQE